MSAAGAPGRSSGPRQHEISRGLTLALLAATLLVIAAGLLPHTRGPFGGDEPYIFANVHSPELRERTFVFNGDFPGRSGSAWYRGHERYQRRYVRLLPSALLGVEASLFGSHAPSYKRVSLALHLISCGLGFFLLLRLIKDPRKAALLVAPLGLHPVVDQPIDWVACQPILVAGLFSLLAGTAWVFRVQRGGIVGWAVPLFGFIAITSYEAAIAVPILLLGIDLVAAKTHSTRALTLGMRATLLSIYPVYFAIIWANAQDATLTDSSYRAGLGEFFGIAAADGYGYLVRSFVGVMRWQPISLLRWVSQPLVLACLLATVGFAGLRLGRRPATLFGLVVYLALLAPPLISRAEVSFTNYPSNRQLYLPLLGIAIFAASMWRRPFRWPHLIAPVLLCGLFAAYHGDRPDPMERQQLHARMGALVREELAKRPPGTPIVGLGNSRCGYDPRLDAASHPVYDLIPTTIKGEVPQLKVEGENVLRVFSPDGLFVVSTALTRKQMGRVPPLMPDLARIGSQRIDIATVTTPEPALGKLIHELRYTFDAPLSDYLFMVLRDCDLPKVLKLP